MRAWGYLMVHHSAGHHRLTVDELDRMHRARGFDGPGYHFGLFLGDGEEWHLKRLRPDSRPGAHCLNGWNYRALGLVVPGYYHPGSILSRRVGAAQYESILRACLHIMQLYRMPAGRLLGHRDGALTSCPGDWFPLTRLKQDVTSILRGR